MQDTQRKAVLDRIADEGSTVGAEVFAHAVDLDTGAEIGFQANDPVVTASVFKVPILTEYVRQVAAGELDPKQRVFIRADAVTAGSTGLSVFSDDTEWSLRDIATSMITVSDNAATDIMIRIVGLDRINASMVELGLTDTVLISDCAKLFESIAEAYGVDYKTARISRLMAEDPERTARLAINIPLRTNRSTARDSTQLLQLLWTDRAAGPEACAEARRILGLQVWPHRLSSGFPSDDIRISGKTGTIGFARNEIGVVEFPNGRRFAVAVFLRTYRLGYRQPSADALIGTVSRLLVEQLLTI